ncbi:SRPBCC family protein [Nonomuraea sp. NPDC050783]|uniref:SRPBCC family protein n=1 Tax=Nonomuraea sp. NPDC050783 TaxID=3154634 RepID=UPI003467AF83
MREITSSIDIAASPEQVWDVLVDFAGYSTWNPFIREGAGQAVVGETLVLKMYPENGKPMTFRPRVLEAERGRTLKWLGRFVLPGLFDGAHSFVLTATPQGTHLVQSEAFKGLLVPFLGSMIEGTSRNFARLNEALKQEVEQRAG